jgi:hypothetical protein
VYVNIYICTHTDPHLCAYALLLCHFHTYRSIQRRGGHNGVLHHNSSRHWKILFDVDRMFGLNNFTYIYMNIHMNIYMGLVISHIYTYIYIYMCVASEECFHIDRMSGLNDFTYMYINIQGFGDFTYIYIYLCIIFTLIKCSGSMISHIYV